MQSAVALIEPIFDAQLASIRASRVKAMDETPIKAGPRARQDESGVFLARLWEQDEICFLYYPSRSAGMCKRRLACRRRKARYCKAMATRPMRSMRRRRDHPRSMLGAFETQGLRSERYRAAHAEQVSILITAAINSHELPPLNLVGCRHRFS